jgi:hypothetical protein
MSDREFYEESPEWELDDFDLESSDDLDLDIIAEEDLSEFIDEEYFDWLKEYFEPFFEKGDANWDEIDEQIRRLGLDN